MAGRSGGPRPGRRSIGPHGPLLGRVGQAAGQGATAGAGWLRQPAHLRLWGSQTTIEACPDGVAAQDVPEGGPTAGYWGQAPAALSAEADAGVQVLCETVCRL